MDQRDINKYKFYSGIKNNDFKTNLGYQGNRDVARVCTQSRLESDTPTVNGRGGGSLVEQLRITVHYNGILCDTCHGADDSFCVDPVSDTNTSRG